MSASPSKAFVLSGFVLIGANLNPGKNLVIPSPFLSESSETDDNSEQPGQQQAERTESLEELAKLRLVEKRKENADSSETNDNSEQPGQQQAERTESLEELAKLRLVKTTIEIFEQAQPATATVKEKTSEKEEKSEEEEVGGSMLPKDRPAGADNDLEIVSEEREKYEEAQKDGKQLGHIILENSNDEDPASQELQSVIKGKLKDSAYNFGFTQFAQQKETACVADRCHKVTEVAHSLIVEADVQKLQELDDELLTVTNQLPKRDPPNDVKRRLLEAPPDSELGRLEEAIRGKLKDSSTYNRLFQDRLTKECVNNSSYCHRAYSLLAEADVQKLEELSKKSKLTLVPLLGKLVRSRVDDQELTEKVKQLKADILKKLTESDTFKNNYRDEFKKYGKDKKLNLCGDLCRHRVRRLLWKARWSSR